MVVVVVVVEELVYIKMSTEQDRARKKQTRLANALRYGAIVCRICKLKSSTPNLHLAHVKAEHSDLHELCAFCLKYKIIYRSGTKKTLTTTSATHVRDCCRMHKNTEILVAKRLHNIKQQKSILRDFIGETFTSSILCRHDIEQGEFTYNCITYRKVPQELFSIGCEEYEENTSTRLSDSTEILGQTIITTLCESKAPSWWGLLSDDFDWKFQHVAHNTFKFNQNYNIDEQLARISYFTINKRLHFFAVRVYKCAWKKFEEFAKKDTIDGNFMILPYACLCNWKKVLHIHFIIVAQSEMVFKQYFEIVCTHSEITLPYYKHNCVDIVTIESIGILFDECVFVSQNSTANETEQGIKLNRVCNRPTDEEKQFLNNRSKEDFYTTIKRFKHGNIQIDSRRYSQRKITYSSLFDIDMFQQIGYRDAPAFIHEYINNNARTHEFQGSHLYTHRQLTNISAMLFYSQTGEGIFGYYRHRLGTSSAIDDSLYLTQFDTDQPKLKGCISFVELTKSIENLNIPPLCIKLPFASNDYLNNLSERLQVYSQQIKESALKTSDDHPLKNEQLFMLSQHTLKVVINPYLKRMMYSCKNDVTITPDIFTQINPIYDLHEDQLPKALLQSLTVCKLEKKIFSIDQFNI